MSSKTDAHSAQIEIAQLLKALNATDLDDLLSQLDGEDREVALMRIKEFYQEKLADS